MNTFEQELARSLKLLSDNDSVEWDRIKDDRHNIGGKHLKAKASKFDFWAVNKDGKFFGLEAKSTKLKSLPFNNIKQHQIDALVRLFMNFQSTGAFLINFRWGRGKIRTFSISAVKIVQYMRHADRKSFPFEFFLKQAIEIPKIKTTEGTIAWDLKQILRISNESSNRNKRRD